MHCVLCAVRQPIAVRQGETLIRALTPPQFCALEGLMPSNTLLSDTYRGHGYCDAASLQRDERAVTMLYIIHKYFYLSTPLLVPKSELVL